MNHIPRARQQRQKMLQQQQHSGQNLLYTSFNMLKIIRKNRPENSGKNNKSPWVSLSLSMENINDGPSTCAQAVVRNNSVNYIIMDLSNATCTVMVLESFIKRKIVRDATSFYCL